MTVHHRIILGGAMSSILSPELTLYGFELLMAQMKRQVIRKRRRGMVTLPVMVASG